jgi:hypothetical protein
MNAINFGPPQAQKIAALYDRKKAQCEKKGLFDPLMVPLATSLLDFKRAEVSQSHHYHIA